MDQQRKCSASEFKNTSGRAEPRVLDENGTNETHWSTAQSRQGSDQYTQIYVHIHTHRWKKNYVYSTFLVFYLVGKGGVATKLSVRAKHS